MLRVTRKVDVVLIDTYSTLNFWYAVLVSQLARLLRVPYVPILHGGSLPKRLKRNPWLCRQVFNHSLINVAPSGYLETAFQRSGYATTRIPNFININQYPYHERRLVGPRLLWVRSLASAYHPEMAIRVLARLTGKHIPSRLCMVAARQQRRQPRPLPVPTEELSESEKARLQQKPTGSPCEYDIFINTTNYDNTPGVSSCYGAEYDIFHQHHLPTTIRPSTVASKRWLGFAAIAATLRQAQALSGVTPYRARSFNTLRRGDRIGTGRVAHRQLEPGKRPLF
ncbi:MAG: glycosyltransferase [Lewinellaceae bacterium]|nr:glycosyltransferase [Lewinellaceae bacterium]